MDMRGDLETEGLCTSNQVYGWSMMTHITDMHGYLRPASSGWLFKSPLAGGGAYCGSPTSGHTACYRI